MKSSFRLLWTVLCINCFCVAQDAVAYTELQLYTVEYPSEFVYGETYQIPVTYELYGVSAEELKALSSPHTFKTTVRIGAITILKSTAVPGTEVTITAAPDGTALITDYIVFDASKLSLGLSGVQCRIDCEIIGTSLSYYGNYSWRNVIYPSTPSSSNPGGIGEVSFNLVWGYDSLDEGPDIDLHVVDPTGAHIYYGNQAGHFDLDDLGESGSGDGAGPERAYWDPALVGTYTYYAKWYQNNSSATSANATLHVYRKVNGVQQLQATKQVVLSASSSESTHWAYTVTAPAPTLSYIMISGSTSVNESSGSSYSCRAYYSDESSKTVAPSWSENSSYASISSSGYLSTFSVSSDKSCTITASYGGKSDTHNITIKNAGVTPTLSYITISGSTSVNESSGSSYSCRAYYSDESSKIITPSWSENSSYASISSSGYLSAFSVSSDKSCTITASYGGKSDTHGVIIKNATSSSGADLALLNLSATRSSSTARTFSGCSFQIKNNGPTALTSERIIVDYYLSNDTVFGNADDRRIGDTGFTVSVASGGQGSITLNSGGRTYMTDLWTQNLVSNGSYYLYAKVRIDDGTPIDPVSNNNQDRTSGTYSYTDAPQLVLKSISISGSSTVNENSSSPYACMAHYNDGSTSNVTLGATLSLTSPYATVWSSGQVNTKEIGKDQTCTLRMYYKNKSVSKKITIKDVPAPMCHVLGARLDFSWNADVKQLIVMNLGAGTLTCNLSVVEGGDYFSIDQSSLSVGNGSPGSAVVSCDRSALDLGETVSGKIKLITNVGTYYVTLTASKTALDMPIKVYSNGQCDVYRLWAPPEGVPDDFKERLAEWALEDVVSWAAVSKLKLSPVLSLLSVFSFVDVLDYWVRVVPVFPNESALKSKELAVGMPLAVQVHLDFRTTARHVDLSLAVTQGGYPGVRRVEDRKLLSVAEMSQFEKGYYYIVCPAMIWTEDWTQYTELQWTGKRLASMTITAEMGLIGRDSAECYLLHPNDASEESLNLIPDGTVVVTTNEYGLSTLVDLWDLSGTYADGLLGMNFTLAQDGKGKLLGTGRWTGSVISQGSHAVDALFVVKGKIKTEKDGSTSLKLQIKHKGTAVDAGVTNKFTAQQTITAAVDPVELEMNGELKTSIKMGKQKIKQVDVFGEDLPIGMDGSSALTTELWEDSKGKIYGQADCELSNLERIFFRVSGKPNAKTGTVKLGLKGRKETGDSGAKLSVEVSGDYEDIQTMKGKVMGQKILVE